MGTARRFSRQAERNIISEREVLWRARSWLRKSQAVPGGEEATLNGEAALPHNIRAVASIDYLNSYVFRLAFSETFTQAVNSEVKSNAFLSKTYNGFFF